MNKWLLMGCLVLAGCSNQSGAKFEWFSGKAPVIAIVHDELFVGEAEASLLGRGTIQMQSRQDTALRCAGEFQYLTIPFGAGEL